MEDGWTRGGGAPPHDGRHGDTLRYGGNGRHTGALRATVRAWAKAHGTRSRTLPRAAGAGRVVAGAFAVAAASCKWLWVVWVVVVAKSRHKILTTFAFTWASFNLR